MQGQTGKLPLNLGMFKSSETLQVPLRFLWH